MLFFFKGQTVRAGTKTILHDITKKNMVDGMAYTQLGRPQRLEDIYICGEFEVAGIRCDQAAFAETKKLEVAFDNARIATKNQRDNHWKISYLNVNSLNAHFDDVEVDNEINDSDIIGLAETWLNQNQIVEFNGYDGYFANFGRGKGQAAFSKIPLSSVPAIVATDRFSAILLMTDHFNAIFLYLSQNYNRDLVFNTLKDWILDTDIPTALLGDINENEHGVSKFHQFMKNEGFTQHIKDPTFIAGSLLDHLYVNKAMEEKNIFFEKNSCYYSDHDIISLFIEK